MTTPTLRGRAATPVRPGLVIKSVLMSVTPLATGEFVQEAAMTDLHNAYKELIRRENTLRPRAKYLTPMTQFSFKTLFKFAQLLNLVELVREEPMQFPPPGGNLLSIRRPDGELSARVVISTRRIFKISAIGAEDEKSWTNLNKAWREQWPAPQKAEYLPPVFAGRPPREEPPEIVEEVEPSFTPYKWKDTYNERNIISLADYLSTLDELGAPDSEVQNELLRLSGKIGGWIVEADESLDEVKAITFVSEIIRFQGIISTLTIVREALMDYDIPRAISSLAGLLS